MLNISYATWKSIFLTKKVLQFFLVKWGLSLAVPCGGICMSQTKLKRAQFSITELLKQDYKHSYASKADMKHMLFRCIKDLHELGYMLGHIKGLKPKHIPALVLHWQSQGKNPATIKNYLSKL